MRDDSVGGRTFDAVCRERDRLMEDRRKCVHALGYIMTNPAEAVRVAREALSMVSPQTNPEAKS